MTSASSDNRLRLGTFVVGLVLAVAACGESSSVTSGSEGGTTSTPTNATPDATFNLRDPEPAGEDWTLAASGTDAEVAWSIYTTPATDDGVCYSIELQPPPEASFYEPLDESEVYKGRSKGCLTRPGTRIHGLPAEISRGSDLASSPYTFVYGGLSDNVRRVAATTSAGQTAHSVVKDEGATVFLLFARRGERIDRLHFTLDDGSDTTCAIRWIKGAALLGECS